MTESTALKVKPSENRQLKDVKTKPFGIELHIIFDTKLTELISKNRQSHVNSKALKAEVGMKLDQQIRKSLEVKLPEVNYTDINEIKVIVLMSGNHASSIYKVDMKFSDLDVSKQGLIEELEKEKRDMFHTRLEIIEKRLNISNPLTDPNAPQYEWDSETFRMLMKSAISGKRHLVFEDKVYLSFEQIKSKGHFYQHKDIIGLRLTDENIEEMTDRISASIKWYRKVIGNYVAFASEQRGND